MEQVRSARRQLGEVFTHFLDNEHWDRQKVARRCRCSTQDIERWAAGHLVPSTDQWGALMARYGHDLARYRDLWTRARLEQQEERDALRNGISKMSAQRNGAPAPVTIGTNLGDLLARELPKVPAPQLEPDRLPGSEQHQATHRNTIRGPRRILPPGAMTDAAQEERRRFARGVLIQRPTIRLTGNDSLRELLIQRFGASMAWGTLDEIRKEILAEDREREIAERVAQASKTTPIEPASVAATIPANTPGSSPTHGGAVNMADLDAAVSLILGAVPNLQTLTITVDDSGEASVDYQIREVKVTTTGGSLKVRR